MALYALIKGSDERKLFERIYDWRLKGKAQGLRLVRIDVLESYTSVGTRWAKGAMSADAWSVYGLLNLGTAADEVGGSRTALQYLLPWATPGDGAPKGESRSRVAAMRYFARTGDALLTAGAFHSLEAFGLPVKTNVESFSGHEYRPSNPEEPRTNPHANLVWVASKNLRK